VALLEAHRRLFDRLRPGIELVYWMHAGWEAYCRFYQTGEIAWGRSFPSAVEPDGRAALWQLHGKSVTKQGRSGLLCGLAGFGILEEIRGIG
jgi:hypothetical protein